MSWRFPLVCINSSRSLLIIPLLTPQLYTPFKKYSEHRGEGKVGHTSEKERAPSTAEVMKELSEEKEELEKNLKEKAPSAAEVMKELSEEKEELEKNLKEKARQGVVSQTSDKLFDAAVEAVGRNPNPEAIKEKYKEAGPGETYHKPRDDAGVGPTTIR